MPYHPEVQEMFNAQAEHNKLWRGGKVSIISENRELTYKECYEREVEVSRQRHARMEKLLNENLAPGKHLLLIDMVERGAVGDPNMAYIDSERKKLAMLAQTGREKVEPSDFQAATMRYMLGFRDSDMRLQVVRPLRGEKLPQDLSNCAGVIFSGSEANIIGSQSGDRQAMVEQVTNFIPGAHEQRKPMLGVCFGSEVLNHSFGAKVDWVKPDDPAFEEWGLVPLKKTSAGKRSPLLADIPENELFIHASHMQHTDPSKLPKELIVLASSEVSEVHIAELAHDHTILFVQGHPETTDAYVDVAYDVVGQRPADVGPMFQGWSAKTGEALFRRYVETLNDKA